MNPYAEGYILSGFMIWASILILYKGNLNLSFRGNIEWLLGMLFGWPLIMAFLIEELIIRRND